MDQGPSPTSASLLNDVLARLGETSGPLADFARAYLQRLPWDVDLTAEAVHAEVVGLFEFISRRYRPIAVRAFNANDCGDLDAAESSVLEVNVDDGPFLVDSITAELQAQDLSVVRVHHPVIGVTRDDSGALVAVHPATGSAVRESVQHYVLDRRLSDAELADLEQRIEAVLCDVRAAVADFEAMSAATREMAGLVRLGEGHYPDPEVEEAVAFLDWLRDDNFVFLGYRRYRIIGSSEGPALEVVPDTGLGILADADESRASEPVPLGSLPDELRGRYEKGDLLVVSKTNRLSTVHRRAKMDYVGVRIVDDSGDTVGEARLVGLFTSRAYMESVSRIPILRRKLATIASTEDLIEGSHDHKAVVALVEGFPKDELFGLPTEDLRRVLMGLLALQERAKVRLFVRRDLLDRGVRILVAMPRDRYSAQLKRRLEELFLQRFEGTTVDFNLSLGRSDIARLHFIVWVPEGQIPDVAFEELDEEVMDLTRSWSERVAEVLAERHGDHEAAEMASRWASRLPDYYTASTQLTVAAGDIERLEELTTGGSGSVVGLQNELEGPDILTRVALYELHGKRPLSELTPALEDMGLKVVEEVPTRLLGDDELFIHDFGVLDTDEARIDLDRAGTRVAEALTAIWQGEAETDSLNRLILRGELDHRQVAILRAYQTYWRRVSSIFTVRYVNDTLVAHPEIAAGLVRLFELRFDPEEHDEGYAELRQDLLRRLDAVPSLDEDRILRGFLRLIGATVRTNAYRPYRSALALKLRSPEVPDMPAPRPQIEVFVLGDEVEGIHLRAGARARGGIRWSERREDYRTEILGLMKAQITKNALIVPTGAKGGFVLRRSVGVGRPEAVSEAYETFIRALLDVTDNLVEGEVRHPERVRVHDGPDPYLVVAADKGTARFSDIANRVAQEYDFWLGDAFASGGATGYDHKRLGITARGAWKSLECHLRPDDIDPARDLFTAVGIGDMSGDVFGNGMLISDSIRLIAAFDHRHIFIDPSPDSVAAHAERRRLFEMERSSWDDYDRDLISAGGGVYARSLKHVDLGSEAQEVLGTGSDSVTPAELIRIILRAPVDLLWNGGIGTYVKASTESHEQVGDKSNDAVRIDGSEVRARVVVEGGNLGFTQRGRIEYAESGGRLNTDFIDNSGGVNCSDREVNLKILLRQATSRNEMTPEEREELLAQTTEDVVAAILSDSMRQAQMLAREEASSLERMDDYEQLMVSLEAAEMLDRGEEWLPSPAEMGQRTRSGSGMTRPELAVLSAYSKRNLANCVISTGLPDDPSRMEQLRSYFPEQIRRRLEGTLRDHPLRRELIATVVANQIVDAQGPTFVTRLMERRGAGVDEVADSYLQARWLVGGDRQRREIARLFPTVDYSIWTQLMDANDRLEATLTRWYLNQPHPKSEREAVTANAFGRLEEELGEWGPLHWRLERSVRTEHLESAGVPHELARRTTVASELIHGPDILEVAAVTGRPVSEVGRLFHRIGRELALDELARVAGRSSPTDRWQQWALETIEDDLLIGRRAVAERVLQGGGDRASSELLETFLADRASAVVRVAGLVRSLEADHLDDPTPLMVAVRQIHTLAAS